VVDEGFAGQVHDHFVNPSSPEGEGRTRSSRGYAVPLSLGLVSSEVSVGIRSPLSASARLDEEESLSNPGAADRTEAHALVRGRS
jgi:hypothetical protein